MATTSSRLSRVEERKTKKQLLIVIAASIGVLAFLLVLGIPIITTISALIGGFKPDVTSSADKTAPFPPTIFPLNSATNSAQLKIEGYAEAESTLKVYLNDKTTKEELIPEDGSFSFDDIKLSEGENTIYAKATDKAGNESAASKTYTVAYKKNAPKLEVSEPEEGKTFGKNDQEITIKGKTDKGADLKINERFVLVRDDGSFEYKLRLNDGENTLSFVVTDAASNQTKLERKVTYQP